MLLRIIYSHGATAMARRKRYRTNPTMSYTIYAYTYTHTHDIVPVPGKRVRYRRQYDIAIPILCYYYIERPRSSPCIISYNISNNILSYDRIITLLNGGGRGAVRRINGGDVYNNATGPLYRCHEFGNKNKIVAKKK